MIIGHQKQRQYLRTSAEAGKLAHGYLFSGSKHLGKKTVALEWALFLLKEEKLSLVHPDLLLTEPAGGQIKISQIRDLIWKLSFKPYLAPLKVAIIDQAQTMNQEAQNCFLKTLEEPTKDTILILISENCQTLLPTIVSRCQIVKFYPISRKEIEDYLKEKGTDLNFMKEILAFSSGLPGRAIEFLETPQKLADWKKTAALLDKIFGSDLAAKFQLAKDLSQKENIAEVLEIWLYHLREKLFTEQSEAEQRLIKDNLSQILTTNFLLSKTNANPRLALENLLLGL